jgi:hypothetical protein
MAGHAKLAILPRFQGVRELSPVEVAAWTTVEQTFAVPGPHTDMFVEVQKPTGQAGLGIVGARVSDADELSINFANTTGNPITPTAAEDYTIVGF